MTILVALGSNKRHGRHGAPAAVLAAALDAMAAANMTLVRRSRVYRTAPLGPGGRDYANMVVAVETPLPPAALLAALHRIEADFGRRRQRRWGARVLDLDLIAYHQEVRPRRLSGRLPYHLSRQPAGKGSPKSGLLLPHPQMHRRGFVLLPAVEAAPNWRHPVTALTVRQMAARWQRRRPQR